MTDLSPITEVVLTSDLFDDCIDVESLSPAAESALDAYMKGFGWLDSPTKKDGRCIAATLRAAADHLPDPQSAHMLYAIADEMEGRQPENSPSQTN